MVCDLNTYVPHIVHDACQCHFLKPEAGANVLLVRLGLILDLLSLPWLT